MIIGTHTAETNAEKVNIVLRAGRDLDMSLKIKAERMRNRQYNVLGCIEQIIFETDRHSSMSDLQSLHAERTGRRLYWPERCPLIARTKPEEDLVFMQPLSLPLPEIPDPTHVIANPYQVDRKGKSHLKNIEDLEQPRRMKQRLEKIASAKFGPFLVFHPVAQIIVLMVGLNPKTRNPEMQYSVMGDHRMPLSALTGFDGRKLALLIDPYTGEAYFSGGRYQMPVPEVKV